MNINGNIFRWQTGIVISIVIITSILVFTAKKEGRNRIVAAGME